MGVRGRIEAFVAKTFGEIHFCFLIKTFPLPPLLFGPEIYLGIFLNEIKVAQVCKQLSKDVLCSVAYNEKQPKMPMNWIGNCINQSMYVNLISTLK